MNTLQEGQLLLDRIREMGLNADVQNRHATTAACYGIEYLLELLQDRRRKLEELWLQRKVRLEQCLQLLLLDQEVNKVRGVKKFMFNNIERFDFPRYQKRLWSTCASGLFCSS